MKKALIIGAIVVGAMVVKEAIMISYNIGMGYVIGVMSANNEYQVTMDDITKHLLKTGFNWRKAGYYSGVLVGEKRKDLNKELFGN